MTNPITNPSQPAVDAVAITNDTDYSANKIRALYVGTGGDVVISTTSGGSVTFKNAPSGSIIPCNANKVYA